MEILYLCDRRACKESCSYPECKHTLDITHAVNFEKGQDGEYWEKDKCTIEIPVPLGAPVFVITDDEIEKITLENPFPKHVERWPFGLDLLDGWGRYVFSTREEAEWVLNNRAVTKEKVRMVRVRKEKNRETNDN